MSEYVKGLEGFVETTKKVDKLPQAFADEALRRVKDYTPVRTGQLQNSWDVKVDESAITVENTAVNAEGEYYGIYVEYGTMYFKGAFMATRTVAEAEDILRIAKRKAGL
jgi:Bacteriophage HK97-gp10, putative tail-component